LSDRSAEIFEEQRQVAAELQQFARRFLEARERDEPTSDLMSPEEAYDLADRKWAMQRELEELEQDVQEVAQQFRGQTPGAAEELHDSLADLQRSQAIARLGDAAQYIRYNRAQDIAPFEGVTTNALDDLQRGTERALALASREAGEGVDSEPDATSKLLAELQTLRRELAQLRAAGASGEPGQPGQQGQQGQGGQQFGGARGGNRFGGGGGPYDPSQRGLGAWDPVGIAGFDANSQAELEDRLNEAGAGLLTLGSRLRTEGLTAEELAAVRRLGDALRGGLTGNPELIEQEFLAMLGLVEQLELQLAGSELGSDESGVRTEAPAQVAQGYQDAVAEYFRRLSRSE
jgi:ribosomal protein L29